MEHLEYETVIWKLDFDWVEIETIELWNILLINHVWKWNKLDFFVFKFVSFQF